MKGQSKYFSSVLKLFLPPAYSGMQPLSALHFSQILELAALPNHSALET